MAQASVVCRHPFVNSSFSETGAWIQAKFCGKLPILHIFRPFFFLFSKFFIFKLLRFFFFLLTWDPMGATSPTVLFRCQPNPPHPHPPPTPRSTVVRASARVAGGRPRSPTASHQRHKNWEVCASQIGAWH